VPIDGVGNQGHLDTQYGWNPALLRQDLERFASLGLKVAITEADVRTFVNNATDQVPTDRFSTFAQPYEYSELLKAALAVPECPAASAHLHPAFLTGAGRARQRNAGGTGQTFRGNGPLVVSM
jgi:endo-1,4-beta-xylanase